ncbi:hypothetical protein MYK68_01030 [Gordonia sp. PP30]|uniref:hypothetical protein n=1 Tax=Gordonia sp. PP30 TaxID=2935861 RepID=UPI0020000339|nr:hypothetical protein [Gordonia sp. PP30]UQE75255.1 hypothetical protein MYK68_01030 [Gordonia sp. PP30]
MIPRAGIVRSTFSSHFDDLGHLLRAGAITEMTTTARLWPDHGGEITRNELGSALAEVVETYRGSENLFAAMAATSTTAPPEPIRQTTEAGPGDTPGPGLICGDGGI